MSNDDKIAKGAPLFLYHLYRPYRHEAGYRYLPDRSRPLCEKGHDLDKEGECVHCTYIASRERERLEAEWQWEREHNWKTIVEPDPASGKRIDPWDYQGRLLRQRVAQSVSSGTPDDSPNWGPCPTCNTSMVEDPPRVVCPRCLYRMPHLTQHGRIVEWKVSKQTMTFEEGAV